MVAEIRPFLQGHGGSSTLAEIDRLIGLVQPTQALFSFAYATQSGVWEFEQRVGKAFWQEVRSDWMVGIDHGRTQPVALEALRKKKNTRVRIVNGAVVVQNKRFQPNQDFHMKACFLKNPQQHRYGMVAGSGNLSRNGLCQSTECGVSISVTSEQEYQDLVQPTYDAARALWVVGSRFKAVFPLYDAIWAPGNLPPPGTAAIAVVPAGRDRLWVEAGYVTKNRNPRPGNQIDLPRGSHRFFGLPPNPNPGRNEVLGTVTYKRAGTTVTAKRMRFGGNGMEKINLPFPETYPFATYEGKIIEFRRVAGGFEVEAYEADEFADLLQESSEAVSLKLPSGRRYGYR